MPAPSLLLSFLSSLGGCVDYGIHKQRDPEPGMEHESIPDEAHVGPRVCPEEDVPPIDVIADDD